MRGGSTFAWLVGAGFTLASTSVANTTACWVLMQRYQALREALADREDPWVIERQRALERDLHRTIVELVESGCAELIPTNVDTSSAATPWRPLVLRNATRFNIDPNLLEAVLLVESGGDPRATSPRGAMGLMQLMPGTAGDLGVRDPYNPEENVEGGARYLRQLLDAFDGDVRRALAAYHAGPGRVRSGRGIPDVTREYVRATLTLSVRLARGS